MIDIPLPSLHGQSIESSVCFNDAAKFRARVESIMVITCTYAHSYLYTHTDTPVIAHTICWLLPRGHAPILRSTSWKGIAAGPMSSHSWPVWLQHLQ